MSDHSQIFKRLHRRIGKLSSEITEVKAILYGLSPQSPAIKQVLRDREKEDSKQELFDLATQLVEAIVNGIDRDPRNAAPQTYLTFRQVAESIGMQKKELQTHLNAPYFPTPVKLRNRWHYPIKDLLRWAENPVDWELRNGKKANRPRQA